MALSYFLFKTQNSSIHPEKGLTPKTSALSSSHGGKFNLIQEILLINSSAKAPEQFI